MAKLPWEPNLLGDGQHSTHAECAPQPSTSKHEHLAR